MVRGPADVTTVVNRITIILLVVVKGRRNISIIISVHIAKDTALLVVCLAYRSTVANWLEEPSWYFGKGAAKATLCQKKV